MPRTVLITGCSSGIGLAITKKLLAASYTVIGLARRDPSHLLQSDHFRFERCDLKELRIASVIFKRLTKQYPDIDGVICNAELGYFALLEELSELEVLEMLQVNFTSHVLLVKSFLPLLKTRPSNIIFMGSKVGLHGGKQGSLYSATKFALRGFAKSVREDCEASSVKVTILYPGMTRAPFVDHLDFEPLESDQRAIDAEDIAKSVLLILDEGIERKNPSSKNVVNATLLDH